MCLIINKPAGKTFNDAWLEDFFTHNQDGFGIMTAANGEIEVVKKVPKTVKEFRKAMIKVEGKEALIHLRMRTHGDIDHQNTHPYQVLSKKEDGLDLWVMHNGILGKAAKDTPAMSDTWHYIRDTLKPILKVSPDILHTEAFQDLVGDSIGNNRLAFMDNLGRITIINEDQGVEFNGCWLSNTYAWSYTLRAQTVPIRPIYVAPVSTYVPKKNPTKLLPTTIYDSSIDYESIWEQDDGDPYAFSPLDSLDAFCYQYSEVAAQMLEEYGVTLAELQELKWDIEQKLTPKKKKWGHDGNIDIDGHLL